jgi:argininosuccinate synthase
LEKAQYSINKGLWGQAFGGKETLTSNQLQVMPTLLNYKKKEKKKLLQFEKEN